MIDPAWLEDLCEQLSIVATVTTKRMFGGAGIYSNGHCFAFALDDAVYFKADDINRPAFEELKAPRFAPMGSDGPTLSFYEIPETILDHPEKLRPLMEGAIEAAIRAKRRPSRRKIPTAGDLFRAASPIRKRGKLQSPRKTPRPSKRAKSTTAKPAPQTPGRKKMKRKPS
jgi:DNA transformation protein